MMTKAVPISEIGTKDWRARRFVVPNKILSQQIMQARNRVTALKKALKDAQAKLDALERVEDQKEG